MPSTLELSVVLTTYQRPDCVRRLLASLSCQRDVDGRSEVIVADDGSTELTHRVVRDFAKAANFRVELASGPRHGYRVALCRNDGIRARPAPYLLFPDGACIFPRDDLLHHLRARRPGVVRAGDCYRRDECVNQLDLADVASEVYRGWVSTEERRRMLGKLVKDPCYQWMGHRAKPKLTGCNIGISRSDIDAVNGFDETFVGWGCPRKWVDGPNVGRLHRLDRPIQCRAGVIPILEMPHCGSLTDAEEITSRVRQEFRKAA